MFNTFSISVKMDSLFALRYVRSVGFFRLQMLSVLLVADLSDRLRVAP